MKKQKENKNIVTKQETMPVGGKIACRAQRKCLKHTQNGITFVALVITIIVLLILAGVTINLTLGERSIFRVAEKAAKNYTEAQEKELANINELSNIVDQTMHDVTGKNTPTYATLASVAQPGDYVEYDGGNGYTGKWQVLYNDATYGLQIISSDSIGGLLTISGSTEAEAKASYNNAVNTLNDCCARFVNPNYAISGRSVGSNPLSPADATTTTFTLPFTCNGTTDSGFKVEDENYLTDYNAMKTATHQNKNGLHLRFVLVSFTRYYRMDGRSGIRYPL